MPTQEFNVVDLAEALKDAPGAAGAPGMLVVGAQVRATSIQKGKGSVSLTIDNVKTFAPLNATESVAAFTSFSMRYVGDDHHVRNLSVKIEPFTGVPDTIQVNLVLQDDDGKREIEGEASILVMYLAPYWA